MEIKNLELKDLEAMHSLWMDAINEEHFLKPLTLEEYKDKLLNNPDFSFDTVFGIKEDGQLIAFIIGYIRQLYKDNMNIPGYVNMLVVKKEYRHKGIGTSLLKHLENYFKSVGRKYIQASYYLPSCYSWYIPNTQNHDHPCAPSIRINSNEYFYLLHQRYEIVNQSDAFHLDLSDYEISESVQNILDKAKEEGITIELYDKNKHYGLEEFYKELNIYDFEKVIRENLALENPYPFLVVAKNNKVVGWTGAMWNEESGRGHFDGIAILESVRGKGLGKALFSLLAYYNKKGGAKFMTFYTGLNNHARYIYMGAGFKIIQSFVAMKKELK